LTKKKGDSKLSRAKKEVETKTYRGRFAVRLTELRSKAKLSVDELAEKSGISRGTIYNWESGIRTPLLDQLPDLAKAMGIKPGKLLPDE